MMDLSDGELKEIFEEAQQKRGSTNRGLYRARIDETGLPDDWSGCREEEDKLND